MVAGATETTDKANESAIKEIDKQKKDKEEVKEIQGNKSTPNEIFNKRMSEKDWKKEFPNLINPNVNEIKTINYSADTMSSLKELMTKLDKVEKTYGENKADSYLEIFKELFELHNKMTYEDSSLFDSNDQFSYIFYKANYLAFTEYYDTPEVFNKFYQDLSDERDINELSTDGRPLSKSPEVLEKMFAERLPLYLETADFTVEVDKDPEITVRRILECVSL